MTRIKWFDAVRAFGLLLVLVYHLFFKLLPGGFLGVDIFFTFSGFLITALFLEEVRGKGSFSLFRYYKRRVKRIMLPLLYSIVFTLPFVLLISPDFTVGISKQVASALSFTINWYNIKIGSSYEAQMLPQMYTHIWSLAILMQIYVAWGAVCALFSAFTKAICKKNDGRRYNFLRILILLISGAIAVCSFLYMQYLADTAGDLNYIYFNTLARLFPFFIGSAAAAIWGMHPKQDEKLKDRFFAGRPKLLTAVFIIIIALAAAFIVLFLSQYGFDNEFIYRGGFILTSVLTVVLIYCTHGLHILTPPKKNEPRILTVTAELSFDLYLFHWPFYVVLSALIMNNTAASFATLAAALIFSAITVYGVKRLVGAKRAPTDTKDAGGSKRRYIAITVISVISVGAVAAGGLILAQAPSITSIEKDFAAGYIMGDISGIESLELEIAAINDTPMLNTNEIKNLQTNILPEQPVPTDRSSRPEQPQTAAEPQSEPPTSPEPESGFEPEQSSEPESGIEPEQSPDPSPTPSDSPSPTPPESQPPSPEPSPSTTSADSSEPEERPSGIPAGITIIGDSVPLGAQTIILLRITDCFVSAEKNRTVSQGRTFMTELQDKRELREYVVIALGTNGINNYEDQFTKIITTLDPGHKLIFVTPYDGRSNNNSILTDQTAEWMRSLPSQYDFVTIADWNATISTQVDLLAGDKVHMGAVPSMELYSDVISEAIIEASQKPAKS